MVTIKLVEYRFLKIKCSYVFAKLVWKSFEKYFISSYMFNLNYICFNYVLKS